MSPSATRKPGSSPTTHQHWGWYEHHRKPLFFNFHFIAHIERNSTESYIDPNRVFRIWHRQGSGGKSVCHFLAGVQMVY